MKTVQLVNKDGEITVEKVETPTKKKQSQAQHYSSLRLEYTRKLIWEWIRVNRPDVLRIAEKEAEKIYPVVRYRKSKVELPDSLKNLDPHIIKLEEL